MQLNFVPHKSIKKYFFGNFFFISTQLKLISAGYFRESQVGFYNLLIKVSYLNFIMLLCYQKIKRHCVTLLYSNLMFSVTSFVKNLIISE